MNKTKVFDIRKSVSAEILKEIIETLKNGQIIIHPTDTQMGIAVDTTNTKALARLFEVKKRSVRQAVITDCRDLKQVKKLVHFPETAQKLAELFWFGPLTLVLPAKYDSDNNFVVENGYRAVRIPSDPYSQFILKNYPNPITTTSANISGEPVVENAQEAMSKFEGKVSIILDGKCKNTLPSTIVKIDGDKIEIIREGFIPKEEIEKALSETV